MRNAIAMAMFASLLLGCSGGEKFTVNGRTLTVADQMYTTRPMGRFDDCQGLSTSQVKIQLSDWAPECKFDKNFQGGADPTIEHEELDILFSTDAVPDYKLNGFTINPNTDCNVGGGPVYATFLHYAINGTTPDTTTVASGGHLTITKFDTTRTPLQGKFTITFAGTTLNGSFNALNCDM
ncbi:MAG TPA: hypothetical protein VFF06_00140 [Polyangia bacterium]|nr:hypothetical protein [Polyangia bacterium]